MKPPYTSSQFAETLTSRLHSRNISQIGFLRDCFIGIAYKLTMKCLQRSDTGVQRLKTAAPAKITQIVTVRNAYIRKLQLLMFPAAMFGIWI